MSGIIGHSLFAILGLKAAALRKLAAASIAARHHSSYLAGAYLGSDIQTMPEAVCVESGRELGYGTVPVEKSPITGGPVRPWSLTVGEQSFPATRNPRTVLWPLPCGVRLAKAAARIGRAVGPLA